MRPFWTVLALAGFGWALVTAADARHEARPVEVAYQVVPAASQPSWDEALEWETPVIDALVDWDEVDRQTDCLWDFLQASGVEITLQTVVAAGAWTDALGGACLVIGEDDE
jgi:hypothetical protein